MYSAYQCPKCEHVFDYKKPYGEEFPEVLKHKCENCKKTTQHKMYFGSRSSLYFDVALGRCGNASNGYEKQITYQPSNLTPMNKAYGKYGRYTMWNDRGF